MPGMLVSAPWEDQELIVIIIINIVGHGDLSASWGLEVLSQKDKKNCMVLFCWLVYCWLMWETGSGRVSFSSPHLNLEMVLLTPF